MKRNCMELPLTKTNYINIQVKFGVSIVNQRVIGVTNEP